MQKEKLKLKIIEIKNELDFKYKSNDSISLFSNNSGISLFYYKFAEIFDDEKAINKVSELIDCSLNLLNNNIYNVSYSDGLAGFLWTLEYFFLEKLIDEETLDSFSIFDDYIEEKIKVSIEKTEFDFLYGAIGIGVFLLKKNERTSQNQIHLKIIIDGLYERLKFIKDKAIWQLDDKQAYFDCSLNLSHGLANVLIFLCKYYKQYPMNEIKVFIEKIVNYYISVQNKNVEEIGSFFPDIINGNKIFKQRLSWCKGDLGIGFALFNASVILENELLKKLAIEIFDFNSLKSNIEECGVVDSCLCHGSAGIALIYHRLFIETKNNLYRKTRDFWVEKIFEQAVFNDGLAGFKTYHPKYGFCNDFSFLNGITGVGLVFLSIFSEISPDWDECLLLS